MNDRELLESAARAAGYDTSHSVNAERLTFNPPVHSLWIRDERGMLKTAWNALTDDGDSFRLAMRLDLRMHHGYTRNHVGAAAFAGDGEQFCIEFHEDYTDGKCGAMRRAITRYAAEVGKTVDAPLVRAD